VTPENAQARLDANAWSEAADDEGEQDHVSERMATFVATTEGGPSVVSGRRRRTALPIAAAARAP
jgi:hypothetical protein